MMLLMCLNLAEERLATAETQGASGTQPSRASHARHQCRHGLIEGDEGVTTIRARRRLAGWG